MTVEQEMINWLFGGICTVCGYLFKSVTHAIRELKKSEAKTAEKVAHIEVLVAGSYMKRDEFERTASAIFAKLDKISDKLDMKADKK